MIVGAGRLVEGAVDILFAFVLLTNPEVTAAVFPFVVGFWIIFYGIVSMVDSFGTKKAKASDWWMGFIGGIATVIIGYVITNNL